MQHSIALLAVLVLPLSAAAGTISFDEIPAQNTNRAVLSEEYAHLGIHFHAVDDGSVWDGVSKGDPGGWGLEGSNGSAFSGYNGASYSMGASFDTPVSGFALDASASAGVQSEILLTLIGYLEGVEMESVSVVLGSVNEWVRAELTGDVDEVVWMGEAEGFFYPFGVDNLEWDFGEPPPPAQLAIEVDVMPGNPHNPVNPNSQGTIVVAMLGSESFDAEGIAPGSVLLGPAEAPAQPHPVQLKDVNDDGWLDLVCHFSLPQTGVAAGDEFLCLSGEMLEGGLFAGCDDVRTKPARDDADASQRRGRKRR